MNTKALTEPQVHISGEAWKALQGAYDLHVHVAPDVVPRRIDDVDLAKEFVAAGLRGFALKSHYVPTTERAAVVKKVVPKIDVLGSITLNHSVGGINPVAVEIAGRGGCKIVWMPTVDAANETAGRTQGGTKLPFWANIQRDLASQGIAPPPISILDEQGNLTGATRQCLEVMARHDMVLATGHLSRKEIFALVTGATEMGVRRIIVTHAEFPSQNLSAGEQKELAGMGAIVEHCFTTMYTGKASWETAMEAIRATGCERTLLSTDLGQAVNPGVAEGFAMYAQKLLDSGFTCAEVRRMAVQIPKELVS
jgi:hypothetical protein